MSNLDAGTGTSPVEGDETPVATTINSNAIASSSSDRIGSKATKDKRPHSLKENHHKASSSTVSSTPRIQQPPFPHSSDSLLHHLHTDPQSSHITVCGAASPVAHRHAVLAKDETAGATELTSSDHVVEGTAESPVDGDGDHVDTPRRGSGQDRRPSHSSGLMGKPLDIFQRPGTPSSSKKRLDDRESDSAATTGEKNAGHGQENTGRQAQASFSGFNLGESSTTPRSPAQQNSGNLKPAVPLHTRKESSSGRTRPSTAPSPAGRRKSGIPPDEGPLDSEKLGQESGYNGPYTGELTAGSGAGTGASTPGQGKGYFDLHRGEKDRKGKQTTPSGSNRLAGSSTSVRSRTSTASSLHLGPLPGPPSAGISQFGDGLITPSTDGHMSVGTGGRDGDDELTGDEDDEAFESWPVQSNIPDGQTQRRKSTRGSIATSTLMSPARPASVSSSQFSGSDDGEGFVPKTLSDSTGIIVEALVPDSADTPDQVRALNDRLRRLEQNGGGLPDESEDVATPTDAADPTSNLGGGGCLSQFVQQFQGVVREKLDKEQRDGLSGSRTGSVSSPPNSGPTKLLGSAGSLSPDERSQSEAVSNVPGVRLGDTDAIAC